MVKNIGTHRTHCCAQHGCKYSYDSDCPVETGAITQEYRCEWCLSVSDAEKALKEAKKAIRQANKLAKKLNNFAMQHTTAAFELRNALLVEDTGSLEGEAKACLETLTSLGWKSHVIEDGDPLIVEELMIFIRDTSAGNSTAGQLSEEIVNFFENRGWEASRKMEAVSHS